MERPTIFIGSSSEGRPTARAIKEQFDDEADVDIWDENIFKLHSSYLESLLRAANLYDFAILVFTPDDSTTSRDSMHLAPRDNVLFEHGLFLGRLGPNRAFIICDEEVKVPSDFAGIKIAKFRRRDDGNLKSAVSTACNEIRTAIEDERQRSEIRLLPSTALAIGYLENFINRVVDELNRGKGVIKKIVKERLPDGTERKESIPLLYENFVLRIFIPTDNLSELEPRALLPNVRRLAQIELETPFRPFPFYIRAAEKNTQQTTVLELFDIPTTLLASRKAIELILGQKYVGPNQDRKKLERREIRNFENTLTQLISDTYGGAIPPYLKLEKIASLVSLG